MKNFPCSNLSELQIPDFEDSGTFELMDKMKNNRTRGSLKRRSEIPHFSFSDFMDYLYSYENDVLDKSIHEINPTTLDAPLSHYFINSSHNTFLTGNYRVSHIEMRNYRQRKKTKNK